MLAIAAVAASQTFSMPTAEAQTTPACDPEENRKAIVALYDATDGPNWTRPANYTGALPYDEWREPDTTLRTWQRNFRFRYLVVDGDGCVTEINFEGLNLVGQPPSLEALTRLTSLNLSGNQLEGTVKSLGIADLVLGTLNLSNNKFSGQVLGSAGTVAERDIHPQAGDGRGSIWLFGNDFTGPIPDLSLNKGFTDLYIDNNRFNELIPDHLPQITDKQERYNLRANNNEFSGEFPDLSGEYLSDLNLSHNNFSGELNPAHLRIWRRLDAPNNDINRIGVLNLSHNNFSGEVPDLSDRIGSNDATINLSNNNFSGELDLDHIHSDTNRLDVSNNMLSGNIPDFKTDTPNLTQIYISGNKFSDTTLPVARFNEATLNILVAANLGFTGPIPSFAGFSRLRNLDLSGNSFTGTLADLNLSGVTVLDLNGNMLTGDLSILTTLNTYELHLADNKFTGPLVLPNVSLFVYDVSGNMLTGTLPNFFGEMDQNKWSLGQIIISNNMLTGEIDIDHLPLVISRFEFEGNNFDGLPDLSGFERLVTVKADFPADLDFTKLPSSLTTLDLKGLSGDFPDLSQFTELTELVLYPANPDLKGVVDSKNVPVSIDGRPTELTRLVIGHTFDVPGEDAKNPDRMCADSTDEAFVTWANRSDTTFQGAYCRATQAVGGSSIRLARIEPGVSDVRVRAGDDVKLSVNIYGRQGIHDQGLASGATFEWLADGKRLNGTGASISYTAPSSPGTYTVTASLPEDQCHGLGDPVANCTATFEVRVLRASPAPVATPAPVNPPGDIPTILVDSQGAQYEVFTPVEGGSFTDGVVTLSADPGAVPNGEVVGLRVDTAGEASNAGMTHQRYTLAGDAYSISAVDASGAAVSDYRLNSPAQLCVPLPDALRASIADLAMLVRNSDGSLTVLSTSVRVTDSGVLACGNLSTVPSMIALGSSGAPAAIPTATPEPIPEPPATGGYTPSTTATPWLLLLLLSTATTAIAGTLLLRHRRKTKQNPTR